MPRIAVNVDAVSADGSLTASMNENKNGQYLEIHAVKNGELFRRFPVPGHGRRVAISPDGRSVVTASSRPFSLTWWDWRTGRKQVSSVAPARYQEARSLVFSADGSKLGCFYQQPESKACVWDLRGGAMLSATSFQAFGSLEFASDGKSLRSGIREESAVQDFAAFGRLVRVSPDGRLAVVEPSQSNSQVTLFEKAGRKKLWTYTTRELATLHGFEFSSDGSLLALSELTGDARGWYVLLETATGRLRYRLEAGHDGSLFRFSAGGKFAVGAGVEGSLQLWDLQTGNLKRKFKEPTGYIAGLAISPDGGLIAATNFRGDLTLYDVRHGNAVLTWAVLAPERAGGMPQWVAVTPQGYYSASQGAAKYIRWRDGSDIFPESKYHSRFYRPDLISAVLKRTGKS